MNTKTLISTLALTLALGTLALPGTAAARDYDRDGSRQEHSRDRGDSRRHDSDRGRHERNRNEHRRRDNRNHHRGRPDHIGYQGRGRWVPYIPQYNRHYRGNGHRYGHHKHGRAVLTRGHNHYYNPLPIIRIVTQW